MARRRRAAADPGGRGPRGRGPRAAAGESGAAAARWTTTSLRRTILDQVDRRVRAAAGPYYRKVINATGIILHTALGRAVLPERAIRQIQAELSGYSLVQVDVATGKRSKRDERIEWLLQQLTGAEAATVVNNNAAATVDRAEHGRPPARR